MGEDILINSVEQTETKESEQLGEQHTQKGKQEESFVTDQRNQRAENLLRNILGTHYSQYSWQATVKYPEVTLY